MASLSDLFRRLAGRPRRENPSPLCVAPSGLPFVFVHINKTAGTSIGKAIGLPVKQHLTTIQIIDRIGRPAFDSAFRFAVVRNPWDRVLSHYKHRVRTNQTGLGDKHLSFAQWVAATYGPEQREPYYDQPQMFQPQTDWLRDRQGAVVVEEVGRFEELDEWFTHVARKLGVAESLPHLNKSSEAKKDFRADYDDASAESVAKWFREDIERFGYRFDPE